jgi:uncharacterized alkaline shock family protein YloU
MTTRRTGTLPAAAATHVLATDPAATDPAATDPAATDRDDAARRGRLVISDRVVEKVAVHAVQQVTATSGAARRVLGVTVGEVGETSAARVTARVEGDTATLGVTLGVCWPASVTAVAQQVRRTIRQDVARITAIDVRRIDIDVVSLLAPRHQGARVR